MRTRKKPLGTANMIGMRVEQLRNINNMKQKDLLLQLNSKPDFGALYKFTVNNVRFKYFFC